VKRACLAAIFTSLFSIPSFADELITLWGPETFREAPCAVSAEQCEAQFFQETFQTLGVKPPYILHVVNGDGIGGHKASAAAIWIDDLQIFAPKDFRPQTETLSTPVSLGDAASLKVMLGGGSDRDGDQGDSLAQLTVYVQGYAPGTLRIASPLGNRVEYSNSVALTFPAGAVNDYSAIEVFDLSCDEMSQIVEKETISSTLSQCIGGFRAEPDGLIFNLPITAEFPVAAPDRGNFPILLGFDLEEQTFGYRPTDLLYDNVKGVVTAAVEHFSGIGAYLQDFFSHAIQACLQDPNCEYLNEYLDEIRVYCSQCATWDASMCSILARHDEPCCTMYPSERENCPFIPGNKCDCCTEKTIKVKSDFALLSNSTADCEIAGEDVEVTFLSCPGQPTEFARVRDKSDSCPENLNVSLTISPDHADVKVDEKAQYTATIVATSEKGETFNYLADTVVWHTGDTAIADTVHSGPFALGANVSVVGKEKGSTSVNAEVTATTLRDDASISVEREEAKEPVDVAFVVYNGQYDYSRFPPIGWNLWAPYASGWFAEFQHFFQDNFDLSLVTYNKHPSRCPDITWCGIESGPCTAHTTLMPFKETGVPILSEWESKWDSVRTVCDEDPNIPGDKGSSLYSALIDTIRNHQWDNDAKLKAIFAFPYYPTCAFYIGAGDAYYCEAEVGTGLTLGDVAAAANEEGVEIFVFNSNTWYLPECGGDDCVGSYGTGFCRATKISPRDEFVALANSTGGSYYAAYCDYANIDEAVKRAIFDLHSRTSSSGSSP
jgi:hypothetical protein